MIEVAQARKERSNEGTHGVDDPICSFFDIMESSILEDFSRLGNQEFLRKDLSSGFVKKLEPKLNQPVHAVSVDPATRGR